MHSYAKPQSEVWTKPPPQINYAEMPGLSEPAEVMCEPAKMQSVERHDRLVELPFTEDRTLSWTSSPK